MKMIQAIIRPEREDAILEKLEAEGLYAVTKIGVLGRGKQRGINVGNVRIHALAKVMLMIVVEDKDYEKAVSAITAGGATGYPGDGKIFVRDVCETYNIRTGLKVGGSEG